MKVRTFLACLAALLMIASSTTAVAAQSTDELRIATWEDVSTFDPGWMTSGERELMIMSCLFNGLVKYQEGSWDIAPDLAESWELAADKKSVVFHLKQGVKFHKGFGEMTAADVKFSYERILDPALKSPEKGQWEQLDHVEIMDDYTVKIIFKAPVVNLFTSLLPMNSGYIVSKKAVEKLGHAAFGKNPVGTGPYELESWKPKQKITLKAFADYFGPAPKTATLKFIPIVEDASCETALQTGEIHVGRSSMINFKRFEKNPRFQVVTKPAMKTYWLGMTVSHPPFDSLELRQAFRYAVNVDNIVEAAFYGTAQRAHTVLHPGLPDYWKDAPVYNQDIAKAKALMAKAGKPDGFQVKLFIPSNDAERIMAEVIKAEAAKAGIEVIIEVKEIGACNEAINKGLSDAYLQFYTATIDPNYIMQWFAGESWNPSQWRNADYTAAIKTAAGELNEAKRHQLYIDAQKLTDQDAWAIWLTHGTKFWIALDGMNMGRVYPNGRLAPWTMSLK